PIAFMYLNEKCMQMMPETAPEMLMNFLCNVEDEYFIINISTSSDDQITVDETNQLLDELYLIVVRNTNLSEVDKKHIERIINSYEIIWWFRVDSGASIEFFFPCITLLKSNTNFINITVTGNTNAASITVTSNRNIYNICITGNSNSNVPSLMSNKNISNYYYNANILKALDLLNKGDIGSCNFYINVHKMTNQFDETTFYLLQELIYSLSVSQNINYGVLLNLLIENERRNFEEHALITGFRRDSFRTNNARFTALLRQQGVLTKFQLLFDLFLSLFLIYI
ncbi:unnamed protein product, partial [Didymodactylos carnosus]